MNSLSISLILILSAAAIAPILAKKVGLPVLVLEILIGALLGKSYLNVIPTNDVLEFFMSFGLTYIMFLAGFEISFDKIRSTLSTTALIASFSLLVPFISGLLLGSMLNVSPLLMGTILSTTSLGLILPLSKELRYNQRFLDVLLGSVIIVDVMSIFILAFYMSARSGTFSISIIYSVVLFIVLFAVPVLLKKLHANTRLKLWLKTQPQFSIMVRIAFLMIAIIATLSDKLGFHSILGAFVAGLIISELLKPSPNIKRQLESFGYGFFIPIFFILIGSTIDLPAVFSNLANLKILSLILLVGLFTKIIGTAIAAKLARLTWRESFAMGFFHTARLSLIIAVAEIGREMGLISPALFSSFMILAITSAVVGPTFGKLLLKTGSAR